MPGLRYFLTDGHGILYAHPRPPFVYPYFLHLKLIVAFNAFSRDQNLPNRCLRVGYPGAAGPKFYKDLG